MWRRYYQRWGSMTIGQIGPEMVDLVPDLARFVPPARAIDKYVYSPWTGSDLHLRLRNADVDTIIITGGETDVCVLATMLGAIDWGFRVARQIERSRGRKVRILAEGPKGDDPSR